MRASTTLPALLLALAACSDPGAEGSVDAPPGGAADAAITADATPLPPDTARIRAQTPTGLPMAGIAVVFHQADGTPIETLLTDVTGAVTREVGVDEQATVLLQWESRQGVGPDALTFVGVEVGDDLIARASSPRPAQLVNLPVTAQQLPAGATGVTVMAQQTGEPGRFGAACSANSGGTIGGLDVPLDLGISADCGVETTSLLADVQSPAGRRYAVASNVALGAPTSIGPTWTVGAALTASVTGLPVREGPSLNLHGYAAMGDRQGAFPRNYLGGRSLAHNGQGNGSSSFAADFPPPSLVSRFEAHALALVTASHIVISKRGPTATPDYNFNFDFTGLAYVTDLVALRSAEGRPSVSFTWSGTASPDAVTVTLEAGVQRWRFIAPGTTRALTAPALPPAQAAWALTAPLTDHVVMLYDVDVLADYDAFRREASDWAVWVGGDQTPDPALPRDATVRRIEGF